MVATVPAHAQDLGVIGPVYPIAEPNLLEVILGKLRAAGGTARSPVCSASRWKGSGEASKTRRPWWGSRAPVNRGASTTTRASSCRRPSATPTAGHRAARHGDQSARHRDLSQALLFIDARSRAGRACTQAHRRAPGQGEGDPHRRVPSGPDAAGSGRCSTTSRATSRRSSASVRCPRSSPRTAGGCASMSSCSPVHRQAGRPRTALWLALALWLLALRSAPPRPAPPATAAS